MASSKLPVYTALIADLGIAVTKFIAAAITGSSAMISEGIHSVIDGFNQILLLVRLRNSKRRPMRTGLLAIVRNYISGHLLFSFDL